MDYTLIAYLLGFLFLYLWFKWEEDKLKKNKLKSVPYSPGRAVITLALLLCIALVIFIQLPPGLPVLIVTLLGLVDMRITERNIRKALPIFLREEEVV